MTFLAANVVDAAIPNAFRHLLAVKDAAPFDVVTPSTFMRRMQGP